MKQKKEIIIPGDLCLFYQNYFPVDYLHVVSIEPDTKKKDFWSVTFLKVGLPSMQFVWLLDSDHLKGDEWTMQSIPCSLQLVSRAISAKEVKKETVKLDTLVSKVTEENKHPESFL